MTEKNEQKPVEQNTEQTSEQANEQAQPQEKPRYILLHNVTIGVKPGYILRKIGEAYMVMPTGPRMKEYQGMITLNETGAFLFKESQKPNPTKASLQQACMDEYGATEEEAEKAVSAFVRQCGECGLFEVETKVLDTVEGKLMDEAEFKALREGENNA